MKRRRWTRAGYTLGLVLGLGMVGLYGSIEVSSTPTFCGSCHVMTPYFESWKSSKHANIACVDCHIPPGITAELEKKYEALSMVARYFTGTYGTNPWTEVDDAACLGCHERRLLAGAEVFGDVLFDHRPHLTELRRGKRLRCTSCHSQIVQGSHITVTATTCVLCHFKGQPAGTGTARCTLCHQIPDKIVDAQGLKFDHGDVKRLGMACESCHTPAGPEQGSVPRERCLTCHNDPVRLAALDDHDFLHRTHVTEHKVECTHCHLEIQHVRPRQHGEATSGECTACHGGGHSFQRDLYAGIGGKGVDPMPDVMYRAGVRCEGCHLPLGDPEVRTASDVSCMSCHGPGYRTLFAGWKQVVEVRTTAMRRELDGALRELGPAARDQLADASANVELVSRGRGIHNVPYSLRVLQRAHTQINDVRLARGLGPLPAPWPAPPYESPCLECHVGAEAAAVPAFGRTFPHQVHVVGQKIECQQCHSTHEERDTEGAAPLRFGAAGCDGCHHGDAKRACESCHGGVLERTFTTELGEFDHSFHHGDMEIACTTCHGEAPRFLLPATRAACSECH